MDQKRWDAEAWLAAVVEDAEDAIVSKNIDGTIMTWNAGAERLFGYTAEEAIGRHIYLLVPLDRRGEEDEILRRIRAGQRVSPVETLRRHKDGSTIHVSLSISPIRDKNGAVIGASKLARDITERIVLQEKQVLLLHEMNHRIKNLFTLAGTVVALSTRHARTPDELSQAVQQRLAALAAAHQLTLLTSDATPTAGNRITTFATLIRAIVAPYQEDEKERVHVSGVDVEISPQVLTSLALLLHEFTSNSVKYGALSSCTGIVDIRLDIVDDDVRMTWTEKGGPAIAEAPTVTGFGSRLETMVSRTFDAAISRRWDREGLRLEFIAAKARIAAATS